MPESQNMDAIALLKRDHRAVEELFADFEATGIPDSKLKTMERASV